MLPFLWVFLIQNTQNRDAKAIHLKLDEVIRAIRRANNLMIDIENLSDEELEDLAGQFEKIRTTYEQRKKERDVTTERRTRRPGEYPEPRRNEHGHVPQAQIAVITFSQKKRSR